MLLLFNNFHLCKFNLDYRLCFDFLVGCAVGIEVGFDNLLG